MVAAGHTGHFAGLGVGSGITSSSPTWMILLFKPFALMMASTDTPCLIAIPLNVSPGATRYFNGVGEVAG